MALPFHTLDVFTDRLFAGNPLAVVLEADRLDSAVMQTIAREFNLSETVFVLKPDNPAHTARVRIFTPSTELPFAGHPAVGTAVLLAASRPGFGQGVNDALIVLELMAGIVRVGVKYRDGVPAYAEFDAPMMPELSRLDIDTEEIAAAVGLLPSEIGLANHTPRLARTGSAFALVPVASREALNRAAPNGNYWSSTFSEAGVVGAFFYCRDCVSQSSAFHARMFAPDSGIPEDPATGSAAIGFAAAVKEFDGLPDGVHRRVIEQGFAMHRPSLMTLTLEVRAGKLDGVRLGGHAVRVASGMIEV
ncbi:MAG: PhzF family phenazine biosynthesis protein [Hyphomicrobiaceae bacterium]|nr:PhzF family phenazine biosynthesis protein [Hyphomicrobiaceae bacterium]